MKKYIPAWLSVENGKTDDIEVNVCKTKKLTNTRASGSDDALKFKPS